MFVDADLAFFLSDFSTDCIRQHFGSPTYKINLGHLICIFTNSINGDYYILFIYKFKILYMLADGKHFGSVTLPIIYMVEY